MHRLHAGVEIDHIDNCLGRRHKDRSALLCELRPRIAIRGDVIGPIRHPVIIDTKPNQWPPKRKGCSIRIRGKGCRTVGLFIAKVLEEGGFARGQVQRPYWNVLSAIDYHLESSKSSKRIAEINGLIGKADWPKEMFVWRSEP